MTERRQRECEHLVSSAVAWAGTRPDVRAVAVVGSWARGSATMASDLDIVVLTDAKDDYVQSEAWVAAAMGSPGRVVRTRAWGPLTERRVLTASGFEVEYGFSDPDWADVEPVDSGTRKVVTDGLRILYDRDGLLAKLAATVR